MKAHLILIVSAIAIYTFAGSSLPNHNIDPQEQNRSHILPEADDVHQRWDGALISNDYQEALSVADQSIKDDVIRFLFDLQSKDHDPRNGRLNRVLTHPTVASSHGRVGISIISYGFATYCYQTRLTSVNNTWKVTGWEQLPTCPADLVK